LRERADASVTLPAIKTVAAITAATVRGRIKNPNVDFCECNILKDPLKVLPLLRQVKPLTVESPQR
jgi:hypothetical protein